MASHDLLKSCFRDALALPSSTDFEALNYQEHPSWDSVGHMRLISEIETIFDIVLTTDEILDMSSFEKACEIVGAHGSQA